MFSTLLNQNHVHFVRVSEYMYILYNITQESYIIPEKLVEYSTHCSSLSLRPDGSTSESANSPLV